MRHAVVIEAVRTPIGRATPKKYLPRRGRRRTCPPRPDESLVARRYRRRAHRTTICLGLRSNATGRTGLDIARMALLIARLPIEIGGATVIGLCVPASSDQSGEPEHRGRTARRADAGGVDTMQHIPMETGVRRQVRACSSTHSPADDEHGADGGNLAIALQISRREQDELRI